MVVACLGLMVVTGAGCPKKGTSPEDQEAMDAVVGGEPGGVGEGGLGGSSLSRAKQGLGPEEDGILKDVHFGYDSYDVESDSMPALEYNVGWLRENPRAKVELEGHCDDRGTIEYNLALGAKRARSVKESLIAQGVAGDRISTISYGKELPLCQEQSESCWARNRRVHFVVLGQ
jgi:peptidoglycan-associated lipoprotein